MDRERLQDLTREELEELTWQLVEVSIDPSVEKVKQNSTNSSRPPSSDDPYRRRDERQKDRNAKHSSKVDTDGSANSGSPSSEATRQYRGNQQDAVEAGRQTAGDVPLRRCQPMVVSCEVDHDAMVCAACDATLGAAATLPAGQRMLFYDLERTATALQINAAKHRYFVGRCTCGRNHLASWNRTPLGDRRTSAQLAIDRTLPGRSDARQLHRRAVNTLPAVATEDPGVPGRLARPGLGNRQHDRRTGEFGLACERVVADLIEELRAAEVVHLDETPWYQRGTLLWLWVATTATVVVFRIGSRAREELTALIGEAFLGWLAVSLCCVAYRDHPRRQRCLAHLIRKAVALAEGYDHAGAAFGRDLARDLRRLIEKVAAGDGDASVKRLVTRLKRNRRAINTRSPTRCVRLAREILNATGMRSSRSSTIQRCRRPTPMPSAPCAMPSSPAGSASEPAAMKAVDAMPPRSAPRHAANAHSMSPPMPGTLATARQGLPHPPIPVAQPP